MSCNTGQATCCTARKESSRSNIHAGGHELWTHRKHIVKNYLGHNGAHNLQQGTENVSSATSLPVFGAPKNEVDTTSTLAFASAQVNDT